jgi:hypothetical protein
LAKPLTTDSDEDEDGEEGEEDIMPREEPCIVPVVGATGGMAVGDDDGGGGDFPSITIGEMTSGLSPANGVT